MIEQYTGREADELKRDESAIRAVLVEAGTELKGRDCVCPFCDDTKKPSAGIYSKGDGVWRYKCHKCGLAGTVIDLLARVEGIEVGEVFRRLGGKRRQGGPGANKAPKVYQTVPELRAAMHGRVEAVYPYRVPGADMPAMLVLRMVGSNGHKDFRQASWTGTGWVQKAPAKPWPLYNADAVGGADEVVVAEGEKCVDALATADIVATTSPGGAGKAQHADWSLLAGKRVILWPDNDDAGAKHMDQVSEILLAMEPRPDVGRIEPGKLRLSEKEDAADFIEQVRLIGGDGTLEVRAALAMAESVGVLAIYERRLGRIVRGELSCLSLPWEVIAEEARLGMPGWLVIVAGRQGAAKSFLALDMLRYWLAEGIPCAAYYLEGDMSDVIDRTLTQVSGQPEVLRLEWQKANADEMSRLMADHKDELDRVTDVVQVSGHFGMETLEDMAEWIESKAKAGKRAIFVDPVTACMRTSQPWVADTAFVRAVKRSAVHHNATVILVSHLSKGAEDGSPDKVAGGAAYGRFSDCVLQLVRHDDKVASVKMALGTDQVEHKHTMYIEKARAPGTGKRVAMRLNKSLTFSELGLIQKKV